MIRTFLFILIFGWSINGQAQNNGYVQQLEEKYVSGLFKSNNAHTLVTMDDPSALSYYNVFQYLQGRVPGLMIYQAGPFSTPYISYRWGRPALFLDEIRVDAQMLSSINMNDIALIKVFRPPFYGSFGGANGAIAVYTKNGDEEEGAA